MQSGPLPVTVPERFACILTALLGVVGAASRFGVLAVIGWPVCRRIQRVRNQILALIARIEAGTLRQVRGGTRGATTRTIDEATRQRLAEHAKIWGKMPRHPGWLLPLAHWDAAGLASQLSHLLHDEQMQRYLAATPRMARILRPLCRMLGVDLALLGEQPRARTPRRKRPAAARKAIAPAHPTRASITVEINRRRWPSIEQQACPKRYPWTPADPPENGT